MSNHRRNSFAYTKSGKRRAGVFCQMIEPKGEREDPAKKDRENRKEVAKRIVEMVNDGMDIDDAISVIAEQEDVKEKFGYLIKHGIDIKPMLKKIYISSKSEDRKYYPHLDERGK